MIPAYMVLVRKTIQRAVIYLQFDKIPPRNYAENK